MHPHLPDPTRTTTPELEYRAAEALTALSAPFGELPGPVVRLSPPGPHVSLKPPQVGVAANGTATVMWQERGRLRARVWPASGSPGAVRTVVRSPRRSWRLAVDVRGRAVVVWQ